MNHSIHLSTTTAEILRALVVETPDHPVPGVLFRDLARLVADDTAFDKVISTFCEPFSDRIVLDRPTRIVGIESRGYIYGAAMATLLGVGFVMVRKPGKVPPGTFDEEAYDLEYGSARLQLQHGLIRPGDRVVIVDDLIATGGSAGAAAALVRWAGGIVDSFAFVIELEALGGRAKLTSGDPTANVHALLTY